MQQKWRENWIQMKPVGDPDSDGIRSHNLQLKLSYLHSGSQALNEISKLGFVNYV